MSLLLVAALSGVALSQQRNINPCLGKPHDSFVNDWASCRSYFWCNFLTTQPTTPCPEGFGFDEASQTCTTAMATCDLCPAEGTFAVGDETDYDCTRYAICTEGRRVEGVFQCGSGLRFNRAKGMCDFRSHVLCFPTVETPQESNWTKRTNAEQLNLKPKRTWKQNFRLEIKFIQSKFWFFLQHLKFPGKFHQILISKIRKFSNWERCHKCDWLIDWSHKIWVSEKQNPWLIC